jgi:hypothetical protein
MILFFGVQTKINIIIDKRGSVKRKDRGGGQIPNQFPNELREGNREQRFKKEGERGRRDSLLCHPGRQNREPDCPHFAVNFSRPPRFFAYLQEIALHRNPKEAFILLEVGQKKSPILLGEGSEFSTVELFFF